MQALNTIDIESTKLLLYLNRDLPSLIVLPNGIAAQLRQFAVDNDIVTSEKGTPILASAFYEIYKILTIPETDEEHQHLEMILGFSVNLKGNVSASSIIEAIQAFLTNHESPGMKEIRDWFETTTLNYLHFCLGCGISNYDVRLSFSYYL